MVSKCQHHLSYSGGSMYRWWQVVVLVIVLLRNQPVVLAEEELWLPSEAFMLEIEAWYGNPAQQAADRMHQFLLNKTGDEKKGMDGMNSLYLPSVDEDIVENEMCRYDVKSMVKVYNSAILQQIIYSRWHLWPMLMWDSWGKMQDGTLNGNLQPWGMMEECTDVNVDELIEVGQLTLLNTTFQGKYCAVSFRYKNSLDVLQEGKEPRMNPTSLVMLGYPHFYYGTCMPSSCNADDLRVSLNNMFNSTSREVASLDCWTKDDFRPFNAGDIAFIVVVSILWFLLLAASIVDISINYWDQQCYRKGPLRFLLPFSAYTNMTKIFAITNKENPEVISCLHGMRVLSMTWIVWAQCIGLVWVASSNLFGGRYLISDSVMDQTVLNASFSVDTFFFISGLLVAYGVLREHDKAGRVNWIMYYVHRFIRLSPPIALTAAAMATVFRFAMVGPMAMEVERAFVQNCRDSWWADVLFFTNFRDQACLSQCWYTAADFQIYIVMPLVLIPLLYKRNIGLLWLGVVTVVSFAIPTIIIGVYHQYPSLPLGHPDFEPEPGIDTYMTPWCRAHAYLIGVWAGWILFTIQGKTIIMNTWQVLLGWVVTSAMGLVLVYGMANYNTADDPDPLPLSVSIMYGGFSHGVWALALLWVVFACHTGYGGPINSFLSYPSWQPMSRLTYTMYLIVFPIQFIYLGARHTPLYLNHLSVIILTCGLLFTGSLLAVVLSLMTEGPILGLEKVLYQRPGRPVRDNKAASTTGTT